MNLETERLILRPIEEGDVPALFPLINDADVAASMLSSSYPYPEHEFREFVKKALEAMERRERYEMAITLKETGLPIGAVRFFHIAWEHLRTEMGYWLGKEYWGHGYMSEAVQRMVRFGIRDLGLEKAYDYCFTDNAASIRVLEKTGFRQEGYIRHGVKKGDGFHDVLLFGMIREDLVV